MNTIVTEMEVKTIPISDYDYLSEVRYYIEDGVLFLSLDDVAVGLELTKVGTNTVANHARINEYFKEFDLSDEVGNDGYIPENVFYLLTSRVLSDKARMFQMHMANKIIPAIRAKETENNKKGRYAMVSKVNDEVKEETGTKNEVQIFESEQFGKLRAIEIDGEPWFVGKDVATVLGYSNPRKALADHVDDEDRMDGVTIRDSIGRNQNPILINESGLYSLILSSKLPSAKQFKRWVTSEVLPSIRKTGGYVVKDREKEFVSNPESSIYPYVQSLTKIAETMQLQLEQLSQLSQPYPHLPVNEISYWKNVISKPLVNEIAERFNLTFSEAVNLIYGKMKNEYGFDKALAIIKFQEKYGEETTKNCKCIDAVASNEVYQSYFVKSSRFLIALADKIDENMTKTNTSNTNEPSESDTEYSETSIVIKDNHFVDMAMSAECIVEDIKNAEKPETSETVEFRLGDSIDYVVGKVAEHLGIRKSPYLLTKVYKMMATDRQWKYTMTKFGYKSKKALVENNRTYRERFMAACNSIVNERE